jgi:hypothetical protein
MQVGWLSTLPIPALVAVMLALMLLSAGAGRLFRRFNRVRDPAAPSESERSIAHEGYLLGAALGLLGLLLAFSFGMVLERYEARRDLAIREANAIGTAYLRAQLLDEPYRARLSILFVGYAENRLELATTAGGQGAALSTNDRLLTEIWAVVRAARGSALAHGVTTALLISVNEVIDLDAERKLAWQLRLPDEILILLVAYLSVTSAVVGHSVDGPRGGRAAIVLFVLIALSIGIMADINRPMSGGSRDPQEPMRMLLRSLQAQSPQVFDTPGSPQGPPTSNGR